MGAQRDRLARVNARHRRVRQGVEQARRERLIQETLAELQRLDVELQTARAAVAAAELAEAEQLAALVAAAGRARARELSGLAEGELRRRLRRRPATPPVE